MDDLRQYLLVLDVPGIKQYVFKTDRLAEIRGASGLLDRLNRVTGTKILKDRLGARNVETVYTGGGSGQYVLTGKRADVDDAVGALRAEYRKASGGGLNLACGVAELAGGEYQKAREQAFLALRRAREEVLDPPLTPDHMGLIRECDSCSSMAAEVVAVHEQNMVVCEECARKSEFRSHGLWGDFAEFLVSRGWGDREQAENARPSDFEAVGQSCRAKPGYVGLVYADGNSMGRIIKAIPSKELFGLFSSTVDRCIKEACHEAILERYGGREGKCIPALILLLGGDDLLVYAAAEDVLPLGLRAAELFERKTAEELSREEFFKSKLGGRGLTLSLGVAFGKTHTPFRILLDQAEELLSSAKRAGSICSGAGKGFVHSFVDWHFTTRFSQLRVSDSRRIQLQTAAPDGRTTLRLTAKPYSLQDVERLLDLAGALVSSDMPRSRMKGLAKVPELGKVNGTIEFLKIFARTKTRDNMARKILWEALEYFWRPYNDVDMQHGHAPWRKLGPDVYDTILMDFMELCEFVRV